MAEFKEDIAVIKSSISDLNNYFGGNVYKDIKNQADALIRDAFIVLESCPLSEVNKMRGIIEGIRNVLDIPLVILEGLEAEENLNNQERNED